MTHIITDNNFGEFLCFRILSLKIKNLKIVGDLKIGEGVIRASGNLTHTT